MLAGFFAYFAERAIEDGFSRFQSSADYLPRSILVFDRRGKQQDFTLRIYDDARNGCRRASKLALAGGIEDGRLSTADELLLGLPLILHGTFN